MKSKIQCLSLKNILIVIMVVMFGFAIFSSNKTLIFFNDVFKVQNNEQCLITDLSDRFDCHPEKNASADKCLLRGCCWSPINGASDDLPFCYYPRNYQGYYVVNTTIRSHSVDAVFRRRIPSPYSKQDVEVLTFKASKYQEILHIKIYDALKTRYEPPIPEVPVLLGKRSSNYDYLLQIGYSGFKIIRKSNKNIIFDSDNVGGFIFSDQFLQLSAILSSNYLYGLGEHQSSFLLSMNWTRFTMFNRDQPPIDNVNLYGTHPFYLSIENDGSSHGVFLLNSDPMEVILQPKPAITYRMLGGIFDFFFLMGPTPEDVIKQYAEIIGKPFMPPYWSLGFHLCRYGYNSVNKTKEIWQRTRNAKIPFDVQWNDIDYMDSNNDFTIGENYKNLPEFVDELHSLNMHFVPIVDAGISASEKNQSYFPFELGLQMDIFIKNSSDQLLIGKVWNKESTVWPDFTNPQTLSYWNTLLKQFYDKVPFDGIWIDMNEPSNFVHGSLHGCNVSLNIENPPYIPPLVGGSLIFNTICMSAKQYAGLHYDTHNLYGFTESIMTSFAIQMITGKRAFIISRSTFPGSGYYTGHWTGDVASTWYDMKKSISQVLNSNLFGMPMAGADICGFNGNTTIQLCQRWMQLGAFYPFSRNHNEDDTLEQDPVALGPEVVKTSKKYLEIRYSLLPYLYTLFWLAYKNGEFTVVKPLFFEYPKDKNTLSIEDQFLWGNALMIVPILEEISRTAYLPRDIWYDFESYEMYNSSGKVYEFSIPLDSIKLLYRGGYIIPRQKAEVTTFQTRKNPFILDIILDSKNYASGSLYWDDGESLSSLSSWECFLVEFVAQNKTIMNNIVYNVYNNVPHLSTIEIRGVADLVKFVYINETIVPFYYNQTHQVLFNHIF